VVCMHVKYGWWWFLRLIRQVVYRYRISGHTVWGPGDQEEGQGCMWAASLSLCKGLVIVGSRTMNQEGSVLVVHCLSCVDPCASPGVHRVPRWRQHSCCQ
jgi:hypothetical protein